MPSKMLLGITPRSKPRLKRVQDAVLTTREDLKTVLEEYEADGATPEESDEALAQCGLSYDETSNWE